MSTPTFSGNKNPYVTGGISKTLLTPCRRVGLSRKLKTPGSGAKLGISPLTSSPVVAPTCVTPVNSKTGVMSKILDRESSANKNDSETPKESKKGDTKKSKKLVSKKLNMDVEEKNCQLKNKPEMPLTKVNNDECEEETLSNLTAIKNTPQHHNNIARTKQVVKKPEPNVKEQTENQLLSKSKNDVSPNSKKIINSATNDQSVKNGAKISKIRSIDSDSSDDEPLNNLVTTKAIIETTKPKLEDSKPEKPTTETKNKNEDTETKTAKRKLEDTQEIDSHKKQKHNDKNSDFSNKNQTNQNETVETKLPLKNLNIILKKTDCLTNNQPKYEIKKSQDSNSSQEIKPVKQKKQVLDSDSDEDFQFNPKTTQRTYTKENKPKKTVRKLSTKSSSLSLKKTNSVELDLSRLEHLNSPKSSTQVPDKAKDFDHFIKEVEEQKPLIVMQQYYDDDEAFTSSPQQNQLDKDELIRKISILETSIIKKKDTLAKYKQAEVYKNKHNLEELNSLSKIWMNGCTLALNDLLKQLQSHGPMEMTSLLNKLHIPLEVGKKLKVID